MDANFLKLLSKEKTPQLTALLNRQLMDKTIDRIEEEKKKTVARSFMDVNEETLKEYGSDAAIDARIAALEKQIAAGDPGGSKRAALKKLKAQKTMGSH